ncbi:WhiB family transcriptional regulator [Paeniglutamicibacter cryotolerans]|uniref:Transcriptional regulator WhiB n=1 Tax=Paeniglutamicibacter cryotolerans TaxID=670079 RepID=A0A839QHU5_9MICC|nr:WhiB family transcriptional regulator [Paeniglutamicibacter cryotolerans]MBB2995948.1 WhiB family redox-sensing transcriptional regulator [Paeniglutamicibacter cryotolerans]
MGNVERSFENAVTPVSASASARQSPRGVPADWFLDPAIDSDASTLEGMANEILALRPDALAHPPNIEAEEPEWVPATPASTPAKAIWIGLGAVEDEGELGWQSEALCAQTDPEAFFPEKGGSTKDAKRVCGACNVRSECLEYALTNDERFGIWGGLSERERRRLRKQAV